jgi:hypothetical protein
LTCAKRFDATAACFYHVRRTAKYFDARADARRAPRFEPCEPSGHENRWKGGRGSDDETTRPDSFRETLLVQLAH